MAKCKTLTESTLKGLITDKQVTMLSDCRKDPITCRAIVTRHLIITVVQDYRLCMNGTVLYFCQLVYFIFRIIFLPTSSESSIEF